MSFYLRCFVFDVPAFSLEEDALGSCSGLSVVWQQYSDIALRFFYLIKNCYQVRVCVLLFLYFGLVWFS